MSKVRFEEFSSEFAQDLAISGEHFLSMRLEDIPEFDSMGKITVSLTIERLFGFQIGYEMLDKAETIYTLYEFCCKQEGSE